MGFKVAPGEKRDQHAKFYLEKSLTDAIHTHQIKENFFSFSEAGRDLILRGLNSVA